MSLIRKPSELEVNATLSALIYGAPGQGKSTLAVSAPNPIHFDFDGGVNRMDGAHQVDTVQVTSWQVALEALNEVVTKHPEYQTIVIDTVGKMLLFMEEYIKKELAPRNPTLIQRDGNLSLKGFGERKRMFIDFNNRLKMAGRNVIYVAHEVEQKRKVDKDEVTVKRPEIGGSSANDLMKELDLVGYMQSYGSKRMITFDPQETFYAKNSCGIYGVVEIPYLYDENGVPTVANDYMSKVVAAFRARLEDNKAKTARFEQLCAEIRNNASAIENAADANNYIEWVKGVEHVYNSKVIALKSLQERVTALNLTYNKSTKTYSDGTAA